MKKYVKFLLILVLLMPYVTFAKSIVVRSTEIDGVNVRETASMSSEKKGVLSQNQTAIVDSTKIYGTGCDEGWYYIVDGTYKNYYICSKFVSVENNTQPETNTKITVTVTPSDGVNIRKNVSKSSQLVGVASYNTKLIVNSSKILNSECADGWYYIAEGNYAGNYVCSTFTTTGNVQPTPSYNIIKMYVNDKKGVNIRRNPSTSSAKMGELKYNDVIEVYDHITTTSDCAKGWVQIASGNHATRYVCSKWLSKQNSGNNNNNNNNPTTLKVYITNSTGIYIRNKADADSSYVGIAAYGTSYVVNSNKFTGNGCSNGWYQIVEGTYTAKYICSKHTSTTEPSSSTPEEQSIIRMYASDKDGVNVRQSTSLSSTKMGSLNYKDEVDVYSNKITNSECSEGWVKVASGSYAGNYICSKWLAVKGNTPENTRTVYITSSGGIYIRDNASSNAGQIAIAKYGESFVVKENKITGTGCSNGWFQIASGPYTGKYICSTYTSDNEEESTEKVTMYVNDRDGVNIRSSQSTSSQKKGTLNYKEEIDVYNKKTSTGDCSEGWMKVAKGVYAGNYVCSNWLSPKSEQPSGSIKTIYVSDRAGVNVRKSTSTKAEKMGELRYNDKIEVYNDKITNNECSDGWVKIASGTYAGNYVCSTYTSESESTSSNTLKVYITSSTGINIRKSASANATQMGIASYRASFIVKNEKTSGAGCSNGWYKIAEGSYKNNYICSLHTSTTDPGETTQPEESSGTVYITSPTGIYIRQEPSISSSQMGIAYYGTSYNVRTKKTDGYGCSDGWYKIISGEYKDKYICSTKTSFNNPQGGLDDPDTQSDVYSLVLSKEEKIIMITNNTQLRQEALTSSSSNSDLIKNNNYIAYETLFVNNSGCTSNIWYKVRFGDVNGYVCSDNAIEGSSTDRYITITGDKISESVVAQLGISSTETFLDIDLTRNYATLYRGGFKIIEASISSNVNRQTTGTFYVSDKSKNTFKDSLYANYSIHIGQGLVISDADSWKNVYGNYINNGFVYMPLRAEKIVFETLETGNKVIIHK